MEWHPCERREPWSTCLGQSRALQGSGTSRDPSVASLLRRSGSCGFGIGFNLLFANSEGWRPCWRLGTEAWECVSTQKRLLFIPHTFSPTGVLASVPGLAQLSEDSSLALLAGKSPETLPGLHREGHSAWDDDHALRVFRAYRSGRMATRRRLDG